MKVTICGDYFTSPNNEIPTISQSIKKIFKDSDSVLINFEGPVTGVNPKKSIKTGPNLCQNKNSIDYLQQCGVTDLSLANNHFYDYGKESITNTVNIINSLNMGFIGCRISNKSKLTVVKSAQLKIGLLAYAEEEWCGNNNEEITISTIDDIDITRDIQEAKSYCDGVVIVLHGNNEYNKLPSPSLRKKCRFYIEQGACAVLVHHSHVISGLEIWSGYPIFYGLGNFQFTMKSEKLDWYEGLMVSLQFNMIDKKIEVTYDLHPTVMDNLTYNVDLATGEQKKQIVNTVNSLNDIIQSDVSLYKHYSEFIKSNTSMYHEMLNPNFNKKFILRMLGRHIVAKFLLSSDFKKMYLNTLKCDSHRLVMREVLENIEN